jgi:hypothetical protein
MMRQGPISRFLHGVVEYLGGVLLVAAPFLFSFESDAATAVAVIAGVIVLVIAASTDGPTSLINSIPTATHVVLDYVLAGVLIASPFLFSFSDETSPTAFFLLLGIVHLLVTIGTRFKPARDAPDPA